MAAKRTPVVSCISVTLTLLLIVAYSKTGNKYGADCFVVLPVSGFLLVNIGQWLALCELLILALVVFTQLMRIFGIDYVGKGIKSSPPPETLLELQGEDASVEDDEEDGGDEPSHDQDTQASNPYGMTLPGRPRYSSNPINIPRPRRRPELRYKGLGGPVGGYGPKDRYHAPLFTPLIDRDKIDKFVYGV